MRSLAIAGVAIALTLAAAAGASSSSKDCGHGPATFPGNDAPTGGHFIRCAKPPAPSPPPAPEPPVENPPPSEPPAVSEPPACKCDESPAPRAHREREPLRASKPVPAFEHPPTEGAGTNVVLRARTPEPPVTPAVLGVATLFGAAAGLAVFIAGRPGPPPTFDLGGR